MIHYLNELSVSEKLRESMQDSGAALPFAAIESNLAEYTNNCASWHWHEFIEFAYVVEGDQECCTPDGVHALRPGEGYFVNANTLHLNRMAPGQRSAILRVLQFETSLLTPALGLSRRYVAPILGDGQLEYQPLIPGRPDHDRILAALADMFRAAGREEPGYELKLVARLYDVWEALYRILAPGLADAPGASSAMSGRVKAMLSLIHSRYAECLTVDMIARAANISQREAFRTFRQVLDTTPTLYLQKYRLNAAARLLLEGDQPVTDIALACGFASPSYFCKAFKQTVGLTPSDFRRANGQQSDRTH